VAKFPSIQWSPKTAKIAVGIVVALMLLLCVWWLFGGGEEPEERAAQPVRERPRKEEKLDPFAPALDEDGNLVAIPVPSETRKRKTRPKPVVEPVVPKAQPAPAPAPAPVVPLVMPPQPLGVAFLDGVVGPLQAELDRFWGWRPNDIIEFTDNVNSYQLGVLEATRRTSIALAERISRSGSSTPYIPELEDAMSLFAIDPRNFMFPSPESKYQEGLDYIRNYREMLRHGNARFYNRVDNIVPLLLTYESLLGSCTENLLDREVGFFEADEVFFYCKGVAAMIFSVLKGVEVDFVETIEAGQAKAVFNEVQVSLEQILVMDPWIILNSDPSSLLANHRANMAGLMSRARFQIHILYGALTGDV
jgi:hypothetical protein